MERSHSPKAGTGRERPRSRAVLNRVLALGLLLTLAGTACGGGGSESSAGSSGADSSGQGGSADAADARLAFARCMRENGVDIPDPNTGGSGSTFTEMPDVNDETFKKAEAACAKHMGGMGLGGPGGETDSEAKDRMVKLAQCMRSRGFDFPDPQTAGSSGAKGRPDFDIDDPQYKKAERECAKSVGLPQPGQGGNTGGRPS